MTKKDDGSLPSKHNIDDDVAKRINGRALLKQKVQIVIEKKMMRKLLSLILKRIKIVAYRVYII